MALLVAQTRVESGVHSALEVAYGGAARRARHARRLPGVRRDATTSSYEQAVAVAERAYAPYSNYLVGAAVLARDGRVFDGVNVENAAYPLGVCAEKAAIARAVVGRLPAGDLEAIAITASPCGGCRQWLHEFRLDRVSLPRAATARSSRRRRPSSAGHAGRSREVGLRRRRRAAERRQVDARQRALPAARSRSSPTSRRRRGGGSSGSRTATDYQLVLADLPGFQRPLDALTERMQRTVDQSFEDVDARPVRPRPRASGSAPATASSPQRVFALGVPVVIALNKVDRLKPGHIAEQMQTAAAARRLPRAAPVSAKTGDGIGELRDELVALLPEGPLLLPATSSAPTCRSRCRSPSSSARRRSRSRARRCRTRSRSRSRSSSEHGRARDDLRRDRVAEADRRRQGRRDGQGDRHAGAARDRAAARPARSSSSCTSRRARGGAATRRCSSGSGSDERSSCCSTSTARSCVSDDPLVNAGVSRDPERPLRRRPARGRGRARRPPGPDRRCRIARLVLRDAGLGDESIDSACEDWCTRVADRYLELLADGATRATGQPPPDAGRGALPPRRRPALRLALLTGNPEPVARARMERLGLAACFAAGQGAFGCEAERAAELIDARLRAGGRLAGGRHRRGRRHRPRRRERAREASAISLAGLRSSRRARRGLRRLASVARSSPEPATTGATLRPWRRRPRFPPASSSRSSRGCRGSARSTRSPSRSARRRSPSGRSSASRSSSRSSSRSG